MNWFFKTSQRCKIGDYRALQFSDRIRIDKYFNDLNGGLGWWPVASCKTPEGIQAAIEIYEQDSNPKTIWYSENKGAVQ